MEAFIIPSTISFLILSLNSPTTLQFDEQIEFVQAGKAGEISVTIASNKKTVVFQALQEIKDQRNMVILTKNHSFNLGYRIENQNHHQFLKIKRGEPDSSYKIKLQTKDYTVLEGKRSYRITNSNPQSNDPLIINGHKVEHHEYFSKGLPLYRTSSRGEELIVK